MFVASCGNKTTQGECSGRDKPVPYEIDFLSAAARFLR